MKKIGDITNTADKNGEFTDGNVAAGTPPTQLMGAWFNSVQREILNVLAKAGIPQSAAKEDQLAEAIIQIISNGKYASTAYVDNGLNKKIDKANISGVKGNDNDKVPSLNLFTTETGKLATKADLTTGLDGKLDKTGGKINGNISTEGVIESYKTITSITPNLAGLMLDATGDVPIIKSRKTSNSGWNSHSMPSSSGTLMQAGDYGLGSEKEMKLGASKGSCFISYVNEATGAVPDGFPSNGAGLQSVYAANRRAQWYMTAAGDFLIRWTNSEGADKSKEWSKVYTTANTTKDSNGFLGTNDKKTTLTTDEITQNTGSSNTSVMSQKAVTDLFANTAKNTALKAANGWWKCGDTGLIYQWGRITTVNNKFPIAFPNAITSIVISPTSGTLSSQRIGVFNITSFEATFEYGNNTGFYFAVGY